MINREIRDIMHKISKAVIAYAITNEIDYLFFLYSLYFPVYHLQILILITPY